MGLKDTPEGHRLIGLIIKYLSWYEQMVLQRRESFDSSLVLSLSEETFMALRSTALSDHDSLRHYVDTNPYTFNELDVAISKSFVHAL
jgi:hypothetical protein